jgi:hypothetical protein
MIVESPAPHCAQGRFAQQIQAVRDAIDGQFPVFTEDETVMIRVRLNIPVTVTGVAFFDTLHGQEGVAPNGIELHPTLSISFN